MLVSQVHWYRCGRLIFLCMARRCAVYSAASTKDVLSKKLEAELAIKNADLSQARTPTAYWIGGGLSKSMPESELKRLMARPVRGTMSPLSESVDVRHTNSTPDSDVSTNVSPSPTATRGAQPVPIRIAATRKSPSTSLSSSPSGDITRFPTGMSPKPNRRPIRPVVVAVAPKSAVVEHWSVKTLEELLEKLDLTKYLELFSEEEVDLATFLTLDDADLREIGISKLGARRKLALAITELSAMRTMASSRGHFLTDVFTLRDGGLGNGGLGNGSAQASPMGSPAIPSAGSAGILVGGATAGAIIRNSLDNPRGSLGLDNSRGSLSRPGGEEREGVGGVSLSSSLNGSLTGSFDSAGRRWSRTHQEKRA